jgi:hypothetical protein
MFLDFKDKETVRDDLFSPCPKRRRREIDLIKYSPRFQKERDHV